MVLLITYNRQHSTQFSNRVRNCRLETHESLSFLDLTQVGRQIMWSVIESCNQQ